MKKEERRVNERKTRETKKREERGANKERDTTGSRETSK